MTYTIEQINRAWIEFSKPLYLVPGGSEVISDEHGEIIEFGENHSITRLDRKDFISFLIEYYYERDVQEQE